ncbi:hypothetical protein [Thiohalorhabdus sp.]|uniref:hypothetical protein n=1 Tax=Thiohalorhabdus sp. TaxID=3094134 RepID=UPI002FC2949F
MGISWLWAGAVIFALLAVLIGRRLGVDPVFWGALGFFFGPLPLPILLLLGYWRHRRG